MDEPLDTAKALGFKDMDEFVVFNPGGGQRLSQTYYSGMGVGGYFSVPLRTVWIPCFLSRLVGSPVWDLGPGLVGCRLLGILAFWLAWSFALLVDTLEHGPSSMIDSSIYRTSARIRSRTLHPRIGAHQNGSTSVRFEGRVHAHRLPDYRESQADGIFEADRTTTGWCQDSFTMLKHWPTDHSHTCRRSNTSRI